MFMLYKWINIHMHIYIYLYINVCTYAYINIYIYIYGLVVRLVRDDAGKHPSTAPVPRLT